MATSSATCDNDAGYALAVDLGDPPREMDMKKVLDPQMHTAEHILNQTMLRFFGCGRCFSAHIERKKSKCDYRFERPLTASEE